MVTDLKTLSIAYISGWFFGGGEVLIFPSNFTIKPMYLILYWQLHGNYDFYHGPGVWILSWGTNASGCPVHSNQCLRLTGFLLAPNSLLM